MAIGDWFLARSEAFRLLMAKLRDHKHDTIEAFQKVKYKHRKMDSILVDHQKQIKDFNKRLKDLEKLFARLKEPAPNIIRIKKKK